MMKSLLALLVSASAAVAQIPIPIGPESHPSLTRKDFEETAKFLQGVWRVFTFLGEVKGFTAPEPDPLTVEVPVSNGDPEAPQTFEFRDQNLSTVLRSLARRAKRDVVLEPGLNREIAFRMENKTPWEMIEILCVAEQLQMDEIKGVYYIKHIGGINARRTTAIAWSTKAMFDAYLAKGFTKTETIELLARFPDGFARAVDQHQTDREKSTTGKTATSTLVASRASSGVSGSNRSKKRSVKSEPLQRRTIEFGGEDLPLVLRTLGREAKMDLFIDAGVKGSVTLRMENRTAKEILEVLLQANGLVMDEANDVFFIRTAESRVKLATERCAHPAKLMFDAYLSCGMTRQEALQLMIRVPGGASFSGEPSAVTERRRLR